MNRIDLYKKLYYYASLRAQLRRFVFLRLTAIQVSDDRRAEKAGQEHSGHVGRLESGDVEVPQEEADNNEADGC